ncbi:MAG TPA: type IIL restriction-modification enzyme MmeI, partial [Streptosporangiaceae bacterium]|nr:type IIL restriction-modification enzyme MmeI [Streptosporangiaceae bacterium]
TLAKDKPFSFLDHALRCGDSLVGLISESQIEAFHLDPDTGRRINARLSGAIDEIVGPILTRVRELREEIEAEPVRDAQQADVLGGKLREAERLTARLRDLADAVAASALSTAGQSEDTFNDRLTGIADEVQRLLTENVPESPLERALRAKLDPWLQGPRTEPIRPLHWPLEFPEVMRNGGFDAVVGNPPFLGGQRLTGQLGEDLREYLIRQVGREKRGSADLCSYFLLRDLSLAPVGRVGIIATNTIAQGDTREVGLDQAVDLGWAVYRAEKSQPWPGTAALEVSLVWAGHPNGQEIRVLDGLRVAGISPSLDPPSRIPGNPYPLAANADQSFIGSYVLGLGFILDPEEARALIDKNPWNTAVLFPYLNGEDLNSRWDCSARRWVINFHDWPIERAREYDEVFAIVHTKVRPERQRTRPDGTYVLRKPLPQRWWQYAEKRPALRRAIADLETVLVIARISRTGKPAFVPSNQVQNEKTVIFATDRHAMLGLLSSSVHSDWAWAYSATLKADLQYTPSDCFETFSQPQPTGSMDRVGAELDLFRRGVMKRRRVGLTALYNLVNDENTRTEDTIRLREIHVEIDGAVREAYALDEEREPAIREYEARVASAPLPAWREIELGHGFHETRQGVRFTISPQARVDVLDKLLALNHYRYQQEVERGLHSGKGRGASKKKGVGHAPTGSAGFEDGSLFPPDGAMF